MTTFQTQVTLNTYANEVHLANSKWWQDPTTGEYIERNVGELLMLCVSELAEAMEGHRKNLMDDHLPHRRQFDVEIVDTFIRLFDIAGGLGIDLETIFREKMTFNATRENHTHEARLRPNGKRY